MDSLNYLGPLLGISGVAVLALLAVAITQDAKAERKYGYRQAFYTIMTLVMLVLAVGSSVALLSLGLKQTVFSSAREYSQRYNMPPTPYLPSQNSGKLPSGAYTCTDGCQITSEDQTAFTEWKTQYQSWKDGNINSQQVRRDLAGSLSVFIIAIPLFGLFGWLMKRGSKEEFAVHQKTSPLRSVYFYGIAFGGLVMAVVGVAMVLNVGLKKVLNVDSTNNGSTISAPASMYAADNSAADSLIACAGKCNISAADQTLLTQWKSDYTQYQAKQTSNKGATANDLVNTIPLILFGIPLFWYHFARIRKETTTSSDLPTKV